MSVKVKGGPAFRIPAELRDAIEPHFVEDEHAAELAAFLELASSSPGVLFDIGANSGLFSVLFCALHPANRAVGYEPSTTFAAHADAIVGLNAMSDRVAIVRKAVSDTTDDQHLLLDTTTGRVQVMQFEGTQRPDWRAEAMAATTIDAEAARAGDPSFIKIDVEGYEWEVLRGASGVLERARPTVLLELHLNFLEERGIPVAHVLDLLTRHRYELRDLSSRCHSASTLAKSWASVIRLVATPQ